MTEWEKRLASSPLRRADDSPMIEPLEPDEVRRSWMGYLVALGSQTPAVGKCCFSAVTWNFGACNFSINCDVVHCHSLWVEYLQYTSLKLNCFFFRYLFFW